jgi:hypothetical protein
MQSFISFGDVKEWEMVNMMAHISLAGLLHQCINLILGKFMVNLQ